MSARISSIRSFFTRWTARGLITVLPIFIFAEFAPAGTPIARKVLVLYNSETSQSATKNIVFETCQTILNYFGILTDYRDISLRPLPGPEEMSPYRGIITAFNSNEMEGAGDYLTWLKKQFEADRRVVVFGRLGGTADRSKDPVLKELIDDVFRFLGLEYGADFTADQSRIRYVSKDREMVEFERGYPPFPKEYERYKPISKGVKTHLAITRKDRKDSISSVISTQGERMSAGVPSSCKCNQTAL